MKQFQYEIQDYQEACINNIVDIFDRLHQGYPFTQTLTAHQRKHKYNFPVQDTKNIDIMMETGTGKTFTYIKTIFELNRKFKYKKFIILVPSVAIREGAKSNFEDTKAYFKALYANEREKEIETYVYEKGNLSIINQFISSSNLSALILTPGSFNKDYNILNRPLDRELNNPELFEETQKPPKTYLEALKRLNPIIIMDEPHRFDGDAFKKFYKGFENYFLRFGATFPKKKNSLKLSNVAYVMDSITSFRKSLVKKIVVYTQDIIENKDTLLGIEKENSKNIAVVNTLSNGMVVRRHLGIGASFNGKIIRKISKQDNNIVLDDDTIVKVDYSISDESLREMIKQTIKIHFEKEKMLFERGIKALTLFFMPSDISLYRGDNPKIKKFFEEEYTEQRQKILQNLDKKDPYYQYLQNDFDQENNLLVHKGYFSGDKGNNDEKIRTGVDEILKDKRKLLSFESPTRFIFSIWALQEGWDNPNVFTICKLSNQGSDISKLQQIGRGLRICVNQNLQRQSLKNLNNDQEEFWKINNLDVVVPAQEIGFVEGIQQEILSNSFLIAETFTGQELKKLLKEKGKFDDQTVRELFKTLDNREIIIFKTTIDGIDVFEKAPDFYKKLHETDLPLEQIEVIENLFAPDAKTYVQNAKKKKEKKKLYIKPGHLREFQKLWNTINKNAFYVLEPLTPEQEKQLVNNIKTEIEAQEFDEIYLRTIRADLHVDKLERTDAISKEIKEAITYKNKVDLLELVRTIANNTKTPLSFVVKVFNALSTDFKMKMLTKNPQQAQREITAIINKNLISMIKANVRYDGINGTGLPNIFQIDKNNNKTFLTPGSTGKYQKEIETDFSLINKWIFEDVIEYDSDFELEIVEQDPDIESIEIFAKLPRLKIKTPLGEYNPDFGYAIKGDKGNKVFLVVEAKGYKNDTDIPEKEKLKIDFAKKYFEVLREFYKDKNIKVEFKKRINRTELIDLIKNK